MGLFADVDKELDSRLNPEAPKGWEPSVKYDAETGAPTEIITGLVDPDVSYADAVASMGVKLEPGYILRVVEVNFSSKAWGRVNQGDDATTGKAVRYKFKTVFVGTIGDVIDFNGILDRVGATKTLRKGRTRKQDGPRKALIVPLADLQIGKVDKRGGTPALKARLEYILAYIAKKVATGGYSEFVLLDAGDIIEGFGNVSTQRFTNDLNLTQQLEHAIGIIWQFLEVLSAKGHVQLVTTKSNHCENRENGKKVTDDEDDFGTFVMRQVFERAKLVKFDVSFSQPSDSEGTAYFEVFGQKMALLHGHQYRAPGAANYFNGQIGGGSLLGSTTVVFTGHYHSYKIDLIGRTMEGAQRWWVQLPTLDNGSSWWNNLSGQSSDPALAVFDVTEGISFSPSADIICYPADLRGSAA